MRRMGEAMNKKLTALALAVAMAAGAAMAGCSGGGSATTGGTGAAGGKTTKQAEGSGKKEISISILERGQCPAEEGTMEDNRWVNWINENSPVKVNWVPVPRTESVAKINALFASDSAPDLVWEFGKTFMDSLIQQGVIQPVDEYIEQYSTEYKAYLEKHPELVPYLTGDDGKMYAMTSARTPLGVANHGIWIRQDWLDNLGLQTPTTTNELYDVAYKFTKNDPDKNGVDDTFGLSFNYNFLSIMKTLFGQPDGNMEVIDGQLKDWVGTDEYAQCFDMLKKMYNDGIIDPEYITDTNFERQRELVVTGKAGIWLSGYNMESEWRELKKNVPEAVFIPLEPVAGPEGKGGLYQEPPANKIICMNRNAKDPEACLEFIDWMLKEGWKGPTYGTEGVHYKMVDGIPQKIDVEKNKRELNYATEYAIVSGEVIDDIGKYIAITSAQDELSQEYAKLRTLGLDTAMKNKFRRDIPYLPASELSSKYNSDFFSIQNSIEAKMISDPSYSVAEGITEIESEKKGLGFDDVMKERQEWYEKNKDLFN